MTVAAVYLQRDLIGSIDVDLQCAAESQVSNVCTGTQAVMPLMMQLNAMHSSNRTVYTTV